MTKTSLDPAKISQIYMGKDECCRCGCKGEYVVPGDRMFLKRLVRFEKLVCTPGSQTEDFGNYINVSYGNNRAMTVYLND